MTIEAITVPRLAIKTVGVTAMGAVSGIRSTRGASPNLATLAGSARPVIVSTGSVAIKLVRGFAGPVGRYSKDKGSMVFASPLQRIPIQTKSACRIPTIQRLAGLMGFVMAPVNAVALRR